MPSFLCNSKVEPDKFDDADWLIIMFVESKRCSSDRKIYDYVEWLNSNGIKLKTGGVEKDWNDHWIITKYEDRLNDLASIVVFDEDGMLKGDNFEHLCEDLYDIDKNYHELIIDELKAKY